MISRTITCAIRRRNGASWRGGANHCAANLPTNQRWPRPVRQLILTYPITPEMLEEIITGVEMDVDIRRYATWDELRVYCHRVASAVGLVSIEIFGYKNPQCRDYAIALGLALQMTNIIRDVATDLKADRIYLPAQDLARFHYNEEDLRNHLADSRFTQLMNFEAARAEKFFRGRRQTASARGSPFDASGRNHAFDLSRASSTNEAGQLPHFRKRLSFE